MPEAFERCRRQGGKVRTKTLPNGRYQKLCILDGKVYPGEVHTKKSEQLGRVLKRGKGK